LLAARILATGDAERTAAILKAQQELLGASHEKDARVARETGRDAG
jgi:5-(carboxyamino)imidazole ribonucleotide mutase